MDQTERLFSPCISVCEIDPENGFCKGCWRTADEIAVWRDCEIAEQYAILGRMHGRRKIAKAAQGTQ